MKMIKSMLEKGSKYIFVLKKKKNYHFHWDKQTLNLVFLSLTLDLTSTTTTKIQRYFLLENLNKMTLQLCVYSVYQFEIIHPR